MHVLPPDIALLLTLTSSNYPYLEHTLIVPKVFEPFKTVLIYSYCWPTESFSVIGRPISDL